MGLRDWLYCGLGLIFVSAALVLEWAAAVIEHAPFPECPHREPVTNLDDASEDPGAD